MGENETTGSEVAAKASSNDVDAILSSIIKWRGAKGNHWKFEAD